MSAVSTSIDVKVRRAWQCLKCPEDDAFCGQRFRVECHLMRDHQMDVSYQPYYCSLCSFCCTTRKELEKHVQHYKPHKILVARAVEESTYHSDTQYFVTNTNPEPFIVNQHLKQLSREESVARSKPRKAIVSSAAGSAIQSISSSFPPAYIPTFGPGPAPVCQPLPVFNITEMDSFIKEVLEEQAPPETTTTVDRLGNTTTTTTEEVILPAKDDIPRAGSPAIPTPLLGSPVRSIILKDREQDSLDILPMLLDSGEAEPSRPSPSHPSADWDMVPIPGAMSVQDQDTSSQHKSTKSVKSTESTVSSSPGSRTCNTSNTTESLLKSLLDEVSALRKDNATLVQQNSEMSTTVNNVHAECKVMKAQITGLRSVVRDQGEDIRRLESIIQNQPFRPRFRPNFTNRVNRRPAEHQRRSITPCPSTPVKRKKNVKSVIVKRPKTTSPKKK